MSEPPPLRRPIFIVGTVRSGTTLLAQCLGQHPEVEWVHAGAIGQELSAEWCTLAGIDLGVPGIDRPHCPSLAAADATEQCRIRTSRGFAALLTPPRGPRRLLNKHPHLWNKLPFVRAIFPDAALIVTARDLRSTVLSTQVQWMRLEKAHRVRHYLPTDPTACWSCVPPASADDLDPARLFPGGNVRVLAEYWLRAYEMIERTADGYEPAIRLRHRDLVARPLETLNALLARLGLSPMRSAPAVELDPARNSRWETLLTSRERRDLEGFIARHRRLIERLRFADATL